MNRGYYYLISSLPELSLNDKNLEFNMVSYRNFVSQELLPNDLKLLKILYYRFDIINLVNLIKDNKDSWLEAGNYSKQELTEMLDLPDSMPAFMRLFADDTRKRWPVLTEKELINRATTYFIDWSQRISNDFLRQWLRFDYNLKNLLIWLNSNKFGLDPENEVLGNHHEAVYLRKTKKDEIDLKSWDFRYREVMTHFDNPNIAIREAVIDDMRWHFLNELEEHYSFGIERLLGYVIRLQIIHRNIENTEEQGKEQLIELLENIRAGYDLPDRFQVKTTVSTHKQSFMEMVEETTENN